MSEADIHIINVCTARYYPYRIMHITENRGMTNSKKEEENLKAEWTKTRVYNK